MNDESHGAFEYASNIVSEYKDQKGIDHAELSDFVDACTSSVARQRLSLQGKIYTHEQIFDVVKNAKSDAIPDKIILSDFVLGAAIATGCYSNQIN